MALSAIDASPFKNKIIDMIVRGESYVKVGAMVGLSKQAVANYAAKHIKPALRGDGKPLESNTRLKTAVDVHCESPKAASEAVQRQMFLSRLQKHENLLDQAALDAAKEKNFAGLASVLTSRKGHLELEAKISGILDERPVVNMTMVMSGADALELGDDVIEAEYEEG